MTLFRVQIRTSDHSVHELTGLMDETDARVALQEIKYGLLRKGYLVKRAYPLSYALQKADSDREVYIGLLKE